MRQILILEPDGFPCQLEDCPPGLFLNMEHAKEAIVGLKTEYGKGERGDQVEAFVGASGEVYCGQGEVQPLTASWIGVDL